MVCSNDINPMDWYDTRFLSFIPEHFTKVKFQHNDHRLSVLSWLEQNTNGRFAIASTEDKLLSQRSWLINEDLYIGFEDPSEATMFTMFYRGENG